MEPQTPSRTSTSEPPATNGPIPLFDVQLRFLNDSYLSFFTERKRIEENYVESLLKLYKKIKSIDSFLDDRSDMSTARVAWSEIRENIDREAQARQAFLHTLTLDIIAPLTSLKDTQERTRKRIKEDLKASTSAYNEYAEVTLPKLKSRYNKKFAEVEESKRAAAAVPPTSPIMPTPDYQGLSKTSTRPIVTSPQPLRALERRPSGSALGGRNRSPSGNTAFSDLAQQGKKQLNTLMGFLEKSGTVKETLGGGGGGGGRENHALRTVRAKRELDEADKEYRKSVHWLETLRLRRTKILESGYNSLSTLVEECSATVKDALERYSDNMQATSTTQTQLSSHVRGIIERISPEKDKIRFTTHVPRSLASAIPEPILYQHGQVGECSDLVFGFSLLDYATTKTLPEGEVPKIVRVCIGEIDKRGLDVEGIYRVSGRHAIVQTLQHEYEKDEVKFEFRPKDDVYAVASLLKLYFRELPEPVFRIPLQDRIQHTQDIAEHQSNNFALLRAKMRRLPAVHYATLKALLEHLSRVAANYEKNKMDPKNLAIVFGGVIFGEDEIKGDLLTVQTVNDSLMEDLIINAPVLFSEEPNTHPLPAPPPGEPKPVYPYGSNTTRIINIPSPLNSTALHSAAVLSSPSDDFSPKLPPRPTNSIHPSARGPSSPTKERTDMGPPPLPVRPITTTQSEPAPPSSSVESFVFETDESASYNAGTSSMDLQSSVPSAGESKSAEPVEKAVSRPTSPNPSNL